MIRKLDIVDYFTDKEKDIINKASSLKELEWDQNKELKNIVHEKLKEKQKNEVLGNDLNLYDCAYCGSRLDVGGRMEVEHIAHKAKHEFYQYYPLNLVLVCSHCNGTSKKGSNEVVQSGANSILHIFGTTKANLYEKIEHSYSNLKFDIIHPIQDDPDEHIEWLDENKTIIKQHKTPKGEKTIQMFKLRSKEMTLNRIRENEEEKRFLEDPKVFIELMKIIGS